MTTPIVSFSGINSGIQWRDLVDQIMQVEAARRFTPLATRQGSLRAQSDAWRQFQTVATTFRDAARRLQASSSFDVFRTAIGKTATGRDVATVTAGERAQPGSYALEVLSTARAEKLGGAVYASSTTVLGLTGSFAVNGRTITLTADDTLTTLRDRINASASGAGASGVTATIVSAGDGVRMVLTAATTGATGIELTDDGSGTLAALGFTDGTVSANIAADGTTRTQRISSSTAAIATLLGVPLPTPSTIRVGGQAIAIDLSTDTLTEIATKIAAATGDEDAVRVEKETVGSTTRYWLETDLPVEVDSADAALSARTLAVLGFTREGRSGVAQVVASAEAYGDALGGAATSGTLLSDLTLGGQGLAIGAGDTITIAGSQGDGTAVSRSFAVGAGSTLGDLLAAIGDASTGFGAGTRTAGASVVDGRVQLSDSVAGDSALGLSLTLTRAGGDQLSLGAFGTDSGTVGRDRVLAAGTDASLRVDGQLVRRSTNTFTDAVPGLTINALAAVPGELATIQVDRDVDAMIKTIRDFAASYNAVQSWVTTNSAVGGALANNTSLRTMAFGLSAALLRNVEGAGSLFTSASLAGLERSKTGVLSLDEAKFKEALTTDLDGVRRLFSSTGSTTDPALAYVTGGAETEPTSSGYAVEITQLATQASTTGSVWATYSTAGSADTMTITDGATGRTADVSLANGDSLATIVARLNAGFASNGLQLSAEQTVGGELRLVSAEYGSAGGFSVAYTPGIGGDGTALLGIAAGDYDGLDVAGTINGVAGTGKGQNLTGAEDDASEGLVVRYTGSTIGSAGTVTFGLGVGGLLARLADQIAAESGGAAEQSRTATLQADAIDPRLDDIQKRLDARRDALVRQFVAMEGALARTQALSGALTAQLNALNSQITGR
jgi:flagellar hook-associated protein 2